MARLAGRAVRSALAIKNARRIGTRRVRRLPCPALANEEGAGEMDGGVVAVVEKEENELWLLLMVEEQT